MSLEYLRAREEKRRDWLGFRRDVESLPKIAEGRMTVFGQAWVKPQLFHLIAL